MRTAPSFARPNGCRQAAFFHFQEWKKAWAQGDGGELGGGGSSGGHGVELFGEAPRYSARARDFKVTAEGISLLRDPG